MVDVLKPHGGGPIIGGIPMVLISGQPAARIGDVVQCVGPPGTDPDRLSDGVDRRVSER